MRRVPIARIAAAIVVSPVKAQAQIELRATITNSQEVPGPINPTFSTGAPRPQSSGFATFTLNQDMNQLTFFATIFNIDVTGSQTADVNDNLVGAHIHAAAPPGANAGVVFGFFGSPANNVIGPTVVTPFLGGVGGTFSGSWDLSEGNSNTTLTAQVPNILAGLSYINFHTTQFGGGEIRGQIAVVPEPSTYALMAAGLAMLTMVSQRTRRS